MIFMNEKGIKTGCICHYLLPAEHFSGLFAQLLLRVAGLGNQIGSILNFCTWRSYLSQSGNRGNRLLKLSTCSTTGLSGSTIIRNTLVGSSDCFSA